MRTLSTPTIALALALFGRLSLAAAPTVFTTGPLSSPGGEQSGDVVVSVKAGAVDFSVFHPRGFVYRLQIADSEHALLFDSGLSASPFLTWNLVGDAGGKLVDGLYEYQLEVWDEQEHLVGGQAGLIDLHPVGAQSPRVVALGYNQPGTFTIGGSLGIGTTTPERAVHIRGSNAVFRMDRSVNTAAFMLVRTNAAGTPLKTFVVGVDASGASNGEFVINDLGTALSGAGTRRLTINNTGTAIFGGEVQATGFVNSSSRTLKERVEPLGDAMAMVMKLQGVSFDWKDSGEPSIGLIAEQVAEVVPEAVSMSPDGKSAEGVDYGLLTAVLVEAAKSQQQQLDRLEREYQELKAQLDGANGHSGR
jgi:hypothetical protein